MVLAAALEVPPVELLFPDLPDGEVEALPGVSATAFQAAQWFSGERDARVEINAHSELLEWSRRRATADKALRLNEAALRHAKDDDRRRLYASLVDEKRELIEVANDRIRELGGAVWTPDE